MKAVEERFKEVEQIYNERVNTYSVDVNYWQGRKDEIAYINSLDLFTKEQVEEILNQLEQILQAIPHNIPFYAYGDNEVACQMDAKLQWIFVELNAVTQRIEVLLGNAPSPKLEGEKK